MNTPSRPPRGQTTVTKAVLFASGAELLFLLLEPLAALVYDPDILRTPFIAVVTGLLTFLVPADFGKKGALSLSLLLLAFVVGAGGCVGKTPEQRAYEVYGTYGVVVSAARGVVEDPDMPLEVRRAVQKADRVAHPAVESVAEAALAVIELRAMADRGEPVSELLATALARLVNLVEIAEPLVLDLLEATQKGAG